jgi:hypothetical protein
MSEKKPLYQSLYGQVVITPIIFCTIAGGHAFVLVLAARQRTYDATLNF